ncbi:MAG: hypothetical protein M3P49_04660, partial [Actinomycetota bacterium]|nr:hypothetical protein [Actinomycetota bacterium]
VQEPAPGDALKGLRPDLVTALADLAAREDQLDGEGLGRPRTPGDVAVRIGYLLREPGVGDRRILRSIRKVLGMHGVRKSAIGLAIKDATQSVEAGEARDAANAHNQRVSRGGSYARRGTFVADGANDDSLPDVPEDIYEQNGILIENGIRIHGNLRKLDVRVSEDGIWYRLDPGERSGDKFGDDKQAIKENIRLQFGLAGLKAERERRAQLEDAPDPARAPRHSEPPLT